MFSGLKYCCFLETQSLIFFVFNFFETQSLMMNTVDFRRQRLESTPLIRWSARFSRKLYQRQIRISLLSQNQKLSYIKLCACFFETQSL